MVVNGSLYDACLEKACLKLDIPSVSHTDRPAAFNTALTLRKIHLLDLWKARDGPMADRLPRYKAQMDDDAIPASPDLPDLRLRTIVDNLLVLPRDVRSEFLTDPIRAGEWRKILAEFDRTFANADAGQGQEGTPAPATQPQPQGQAEAAFKWSELFPSEPTQATDFHAKYQSNIKGRCAWCPELQAHIVDTSPDNCEPDQREKPMLFVEAKEDYVVSDSEPFLTYGAGTWLMDAKADQWFVEQEGHPHKAVWCTFQSDQVLVVLEDLVLAQSHVSSLHIL